ncbi:MAG: hypothetical protein WDM92_06325 [Caulobacteraceae bacterium]
MTRKVLSTLEFDGVAGITGLPSPSADSDAATKAYVDSAVEGLSWKAAARVSTQGNVDLASPGTTIDGVTMSGGDRVLVRDQTDASENGIYIWSASASAMVRAADASTAAELEQAVITVEEGTDAGASFRQSAVNFTLDTDDVVWEAFGTAAPSASEGTAGVIAIATQAETNAGTDDDKAVTPDKLANWSGRKLKYAASIGDGSATQFDLTHNFGTRDVQVEVFRNSGAYDSVDCEVSRPDANTVRINVAAAPTSNQFRVVILG